MSVDEIVSAQWLLDNIHKVKVIDATYTMKAKQNAEQFKQKYFGNFELLKKDFKEQAYIDEHIPKATHFNFDVAYYPTEFIRFGLYSPEVFQKYIRQLGVDNVDHVVIYSRGPAAGVLFASRAFWTFKVYGFKKVSILNGGIDAWKAAGGQVVSGEEEGLEGNYEAKELDKDVLAVYEDIPFNHLEGQTEYIDVRSAAQFSGEEPISATFPGTKATGSHVSDAHSFPMGLVIGPNGFKSKEEVDSALTKLKLKDGEPVVLACNGGVQASAVYAALLRSGVVGKVYNGSMHELAYRAPELINSK